MFYLNGEFVSHSDAKISIFDLGLLRGYGVFDFLRTYGGRPFHLEDHLLRLEHSAHQIGLTLPLSLKEIETICYQVLEKNNLEEACLKIVLTGGISPDQFTPHAKENLIVFAYPPKAFDPAYYDRGISIATTSFARSFPLAKTLQYTPAIVAFHQAKALQPQEILYVNAHKELLECTTSNFFAFKKGILHTAPTHQVLKGITRQVLLRLLNGLFPIEERALTSAEIPEIEEAFITSTNREVMPVVRIDDHLIGSGTVGEKTRLIMNLFQNYVLFTLDKSARINPLPCF
jgi:branched-chain amino acid aminotransferase